MPIPDFQTLMLPVLRDLALGERTGQQTLDALASEFSPTPDERAQRLPSGKQTTFTNRVAWAKSHLKGAGLVESPRRGVYRLTDRGREVLRADVPKLGMGYLMRFPEYVAFRQGTATGDTDHAAKIPAENSAGGEARTPDDLIEDGYQQLSVAERLELIGAL